MAPSGSEYASEGAESRGYAGETEATRSPGGVRRANSVQAASARPPPPASNQSPSAQLADQGGLSMAPSQADPTYASPGATRDDRAGPGYSAPAAREERPMRQVTPYGQAAMPPAAPAPSRQPPQEEEEDEANSYDSDEASR
ncbi:UNVERIFIED_CONTAM: hypothetical protein K2H54_004548 [Gekko kuhli]